jgi:hypothetical protein
VLRDRHRRGVRAIAGRPGSARCSVRRHRRYRGAAAAPTAAKTAKPKLSPDEKKKVSQACSAQANEKQLHGKDRRTFRAACIKQGGTST